MSDDMIIFTRTYDFVSWLVPLTLNFPRSQRFVVTGRLQTAALSFQERLVEANSQRARRARRRCARPTPNWSRCACTCDCVNAGTGSPADSISMPLPWSPRSGDCWGGWLKTVMPESRGSS